LFSSQRLQILDLGSHALKAVIASVGRDGRPQVEAARTVTLRPANFATPGPLIDGYVLAIAPALAELASGFFRRGQPVHVIPPSSVVRGAVHRLPPVTEEAVPEILRTSRTAFIGSFGTRAPIHDRSFALQVAREEAMVRVSAVHAFARRSDIALIRQAIEQAGLKPGAIVPPVLGLAELAAGLPNAKLDETPRVLVELGATTTSVFVLDEANAISYHRVFGGSEDAFRKLAEEVPDLGVEGVAKLREGWMAKGRGGLLAIGDELGLEADLSGPIADRAALVPDRLLTAVFHAVAKLTATPDHSEDGESTQPATLPGGIAFTGGGAELPGLTDSASSRFEVAAVVADPWTLFGIARPAKLDVGPAYATALGGLAVLARIGVEATNLAEEPAAPAQQATEEPSLGTAWAIRPLVTGAVLSCVAAAGFGAAGNVLDGQLREADAELRNDGASLPSSQEQQKLLSSFRDLRAKEVAIDARFAYVSELFRARDGWIQLLGQLDHGVAGSKCVVDEVDVQAEWPDAAASARGQRARLRTVWSTLRGAAPTLDAVTAAVQSLRTDGFVKDPRPKTKAGPPAGDGKTPTISFEITGDIEHGAVER